MYEINNATRKTYENRKYIVQNLHMRPFYCRNYRIVLAVTVL